MYRLEQSEPISTESGVLYRATADEFPELRGLAVQTIRLRPGAIREPHIHPNAAQVDQGIQGLARVGVIHPGGRPEIVELGPGDLTFIPQGALHWIENAGQEELRFTLILSHERPQTIELSQMLAGVPEDVLARSLKLPRDLISALPRDPVIMAG